MENVRFLLWPTCLFSHCESNWVLQSKESNLPKAKKSTYIFQFLDDICVINLYSEFGINFKETQNQH